MDGLAVAAAVIQFVEFSSGLIAKGIAIHSSATGLAVDHDELRTITDSLSHSSDEITHSLAEQHGRRKLTANERDLEKIATGCQAVAGELLDVLASLASKGPRTRWRSFRHALRAAWSEGKVQSLENRLDRFRQQIMVSVLSSLRQEADRSIREQSSMRESVERIEQLQRNSIPIGDRFVRQVMDGEQWRRDLIQMIHEQGQGELQRMTILTQVRDEKGWTPNAVIVQERRIRERILHKLAFRNMTDRERRISKAHQRTFEWIFCDPKSDSRPWASFKDFLEGSGKKIYWVTGKPGSGKSTLMKYIRHHPETSKLLRTWDPNNDVIRAAFYFWNSGSRMQMSVEGLLQTVLHDCLRQLPALVQEVMPERWEAATLFDVDDFPWSLEEVAQALRKLIIELCPEQKFFVMIDGLDECSGNMAQLIELITDLAEDAENLKMCLASRPWNNFEDAFRGRPALMLQDLSATDIEYYITSKFAANEGFAEFQVRDPSSARELLETIAKKAEGVFLWVHLVVQSLLEGLTNGDGLRDLHSRLDELPPNLEDLYVKILENLDEKYLDHASRLFQIVRACDEPPTLLRVALADLEDGDRAMQAPVAPIPLGETSALCKNMKRKLTSRCRGLLDVSSAVTYQVDDGQADDDQPVPDLDWSRADESGEVSGHHMANLEIQYLHRSVRDYIQSSEMWSWLVSANEEPFDPHIVLLKSHLLQLKSLESDSLSARAVGFHVWMAIKYAKMSLNIHTRNRKRQVKEIVLLLDELDKTVTLLTTSPVRSSTFVDRNGSLGDEHWSSFFLIRVPNPSFTHMMAVCGVHQHLEMRLRSSSPKEENEDYQDAREAESMPLMIVALEGAPVIPTAQEYKELLGPHPMVLKTLLRKGFSCHKPYHGRSAWDLAMNAGYAGILELFEEYRGKPPARRTDDNRRSPTARGRHEDGSESDESNASTEAVTSLEGQPRLGSESRRSRSSGHLPSKTERRRGDQSSRRVPLEYQYTHYQPSAQTPRSRPPPPPQGRPEPPPYGNLSFRPYHGTRRPYDGYDDDRGEYPEYRSFYPGSYATYSPPPRRPVSYWRGNRPDIPLSTNPPHLSYRSMDYSRPPYWAEQWFHPQTAGPADAYYRSGWRGELPSRTSYGGGYGYWDR
ncbi:uncharacterized protein E0L32_008889 [Thyridium curvatum]|uniref:Uncharacterized protein n=1 Tax=Thyridium curvatum TaxID=1093900 RepID=A0A507AQZ8_9PEZI|nr:uncharacterized protein E0L32_008889 [Thyridium curvatum]TPX09867.1 hypothetical protein E0L32_008889 [Thyridium curvatum]